MPALLRDATSGRLDMKQFNAQMAIELAAQRMLIMSQGGLYAAPPELLYECYNRLNRRVTAELLAVDVAGFHRTKFPSPPTRRSRRSTRKARTGFQFPLSPDPGFKRREQIAFGYFKGVFDEFLQREMDVDSADHYQRADREVLRGQQGDGVQGAGTAGRGTGENDRYARRRSAVARRGRPIHDPGVSRRGTAPEAKPEPAPGEPAQAPPAGR